MKFTQKWKNFWQIQKHTTGGFTLVELIVVIAILAILAGIAVPAYNGYIAKANEAADQQLLAAINTAFAAACIDANVDITDLNSETADILIKEDSGLIDFDSVLPVVSTEAFKRYFDGNETSKFATYTDLYFSKSVLGFVNNALVEYNYGGGKVLLNAEAVEALVGSTFLNATTLKGSSGLLDQVNTVTEIAAGMAGSLNAVFTDPTFIQSAMDVLGVSTDAEYQAKQQELVNALMEKHGYTPEQATAQLAANSAVLYAAEGATNFTEQQIADLFSTTGVETVKNNLKGADTTTGMAQAALIYGMYTAYAHDAGKQDLIDNTGNALTVLNALEQDDEFIAFVNSDQGQQDLNAYLGTLGMITDTAATNPTAVEHLMVNGFNNEDLKTIIADATGK